MAATAGSGWVAAAAFVFAEARLNPAVEGFRGLAAMMVLTHHYSYLIDDTITRGWLHFFHNGVDLFFVITGFLFAPYLLGEIKQSVKEFAIRRTFRLYPLYLISIAVAVLKDWGERDGMHIAVLKHLLFLQALPLFDLENIGFFSLIYWTLPVEVMFYGLVALALIVFRGEKCRFRDDGRADTLIRRFGGAAVIGFALICFPWFAPSSQSWVIWQAQLPALLIPFWFGMLIHRFRSTMDHSRLRRCVALLSGVSLLLVLFFTYPYVAQSALTARPFGLFNLLSGLGYALILSGFLSTFTRFSNAWGRWALFAGALSYGVYLFHEWTLKVVLRLVPQFSPLSQVTIALMAVVLLAALLHRIVEAPLRAYGRSLAARYAGLSSKHLIP